MASVKLHINPGDIRRDGKIAAYVHLIHQRVHRYIPLDIYVTAECFDFKKHRCMTSHNAAQKFNVKLATKLAVAEEALLDLADKHFTPDGLVAHIKAKLKYGGQPVTIKQVLKDFIDSMRGANRTGDADHTEIAVSLFITWLGSDMMLTQIDIAILEKYKAYLMQKGLTNNTVSSYLRAISRTFNYAIKVKIFPKELYPFEKGLIPQGEDGEYKDLKVADMGELEKIRTKLTGFRKKCADAILMEFYLHGCDFDDIAIAKKNKIIDGYYKFRRYKTRSRPNQPYVTVKIIDKAERIMNEYDSDYLVPICEDIDIEDKSKYRTRLGNVNRALKSISKEIKSSRIITTKTMRDTWLTLAANQGVPEFARKKAVGHKIKGVTAGYTNYDQKLIDEANKIVTDLKGKVWNPKLKTNGNKKDNR